jgi:hypothetical protein
MLFRIHGNSGRNDLHGCNYLIKADTLESAVCYATARLHVVNVTEAVACPGDGTTPAQTKELQKTLARDVAVQRALASIAY